MDTALHEPTCRTRRHAHVQHLLAADESMLVELETALAVLPICATGRVFVEVPDASWIAAVEAPARMVVTWLDRSARVDGSSDVEKPGDVLVRAVAAWADEMLCTDEGEVRVLLLGAPEAGDRIARHLTRRLDVDPSAIRTLDPIR